MDAIELTETIFEKENIFVASRVVAATAAGMAYALAVLLHHGREGPNMRGRTCTCDGLLCLQNRCEGAVSLVDVDLPDTTRRHVMTRHHVGSLGTGHRFRVRIEHDVAARAD